jgi:AraC-like DNA-binding protein
LKHFSAEDMMHVASSRLDDFTETIANHFRPHRAEGPDRIAGRLESRAFGRVGLTRLRYGARVNIAAEPMGSFSLLQIPVRGKSSEPGKEQRLEFSLDRGQVLSHSRPLNFSMHRNCTLLITRFENADVESMLRTLGDEADVTDWMHDLQHCDLTSPAGRALLSQLHWLSVEMESTDTGLHRVAEHFSGNLLVSFLMATVPALSRSRDRLPTFSVVRRVEAYMDANLQEPITVADLARVAGVPVRSLYDLFHRFKHRTPSDVLRKKRLAAARAVFDRAEPDQVTVTDVAMSCGFVHMGRFAQQYRSEFGETPSATVAKRRRLVAMGCPGSGLDRPH